MSHLVSLPSADQHFDRAVGRAYLADPTPHSHAVQFYESDDFLLETIAHFLVTGLKAGDRMLVIATAEHRDQLDQRLPAADLEQALTAGRLMILDARQTLARFMIDDTPDPTLFRDVLSRSINSLNEGRMPGRLRAYGEMVDLLWREGNSRGALRLEELWNQAGTEHDFSLLCAYSMGHFYREGEAGRFMEVCRNHSHVLPTEAFTALEDPLARLREISLLQQRARSLETEIFHRKQLEEALRDALVERGHVETELRACVRREQEARAQAEANDSYKEMFLGILGHDLRNPLNTVLTTARLMKMGGDLRPDNQRRADRIVASGVRMERMIEQLLDVTRARLAGGLPLKRSPQDLRLLATKIVEELRVAHPARVIEVRAQRSCRAFVDPDRMEQVLSNLLGNAVAHGDPAQPIVVNITTRGEVASVSVHNFGVPIAASFLPSLFDPFKRGEGQQSREGGPAGLGLGLYISERIVSAHGGKIEVHSDASAGTCFEVILPAVTDAEPPMHETAGGDAAGWSGDQLEGCVLVVDDEPDVRETLCDMVEMVGCSPIVACNGAEALELLRARRPCLMILDVLMPVMSGTELLQAMKLEPALASVAVVVSTSAPDRVPPGVPVVRKPIDLPVMLEWMRRTCRCVSGPRGYPPPARQK